MFSLRKGVKQVFASFILLASCSAEVSGASVTYDETVKLITAKIGEPFSISLDSNATTGYQWRLSSPLDATVIKLESSVYQESQSTHIVGAGGKELWTFIPVGQGETLIRMEYIRPWETGSTPARAHEVKVVVK